MKHMDSATNGCREPSVALVLRKFGESCHCLVATSKLTTRIYFGLLPHLSPWFGQKTQQRLRNSINSVNWPEIPLRSHRVVLGKRTEVALHPHFRHRGCIEPAIALRARSIGFPRNPNAEISVRH